MRILLINPPRSIHNKILESAPEDAKYFIHKKLIGPPLGLLTVAGAVLDQELTFAELKGEYDLNPNAPLLEKLVWNYLVESNPEIVGVTFIASEFDAGMEIFRIVKKFNPDILTVAGGLHTTLCPDHFNREEVDVVCPGQAAHTFREVVDARNFRIPLERIKGIYIKTKQHGFSFTGISSIVRNEARQDFIMPPRQLINKWISTYKVGGSPLPTTYMFTSLGCSHQCTFCSIHPQFSGTFHQRFTESIIDELKGISDYKIVRFADANTIVDAPFIDHLFDRVRQEGIQKEYIMDIRADTAVKNPKLIEKLAKAGLKVVICGFESFREQELEKYRKGSSAKIISEAIDIFHQNGIMLRGNYVVPFDYSEDDFKALADYANSHRVTYAGYTILTPMPGTIYYEEVKHLINDHDLSKYNFFNCVMQTKLSLEKFYENLGRLWLIKKGKDVI